MNRYDFTTDEEQIVIKSSMMAVIKVKYYEWVTRYPTRWSKY